MDTGDLDVGEAVTLNNDRCSDPGMACSRHLCARTVGGGAEEPGGGGSGCQHWPIGTTPQEDRGSLTLPAAGASETKELIIGSALSKPPLLEAKDFLETEHIDIQIFNASQERSTSQPPRMCSIGAPAGADVEGGDSEFERLPSRLWARGWHGTFLGSL